MDFGPTYNRWYYPSAKWSCKGESNDIFLTFDDGPHPDMSLALLDLLDSFNAKASFFLIGKNVESYPDLYKEYKKRGHLIANHSYGHLNGWKVGSKKSILDFKKSEAVFKTSHYRPPYGKITRRAAKKISQSHQIIMWDFLVYDFKNWSAEKCFNLFQKRCQPGSIAVFHENEKSKAILLELVEKCLVYLEEKNWKCSSLKPNKPFLTME